VRPDFVYAQISGRQRDHTPRPLARHGFVLTAVRPKKKKVIAVETMLGGNAANFSDLLAVEADELPLA
jgi:hypothetical protein